MKLIMIILISSLTQLAHSKTIFEPGLSLGTGVGQITVEGLSAAQTPEVQETLGTFGFRYGITRRYIHVTGILEGTFFSAGDLATQFLPFGGIGIGYEWNIPIRTYLIAGAYDFDTDYIGTGVELSYFLNESFWIGVRYIKYASEVSRDLGPTEVVADIEVNTVSLTVSFPFEFNYPDHWFRKTDWQ